MLNRFSRDQDVIDNNLSDSLRMLSFLTSGILGVLVIMCYTQPWFTLALVPILIMYYYFQNVYRRVNREVKRMDSTSRSPLFAHFSETLTGLPTIVRHNTHCKYTSSIHLSCACLLTHPSLYALAVCVSVASVPTSSRMRSS